MSDTATQPMIDKCPKCKATGFAEENRELWNCVCGARWRRCWRCLKSCILGTRCRCEDGDEPK
jgi:hypothetical protein